MDYKRIPWWLPEVGLEERRLINEVLDKNYVNEGEYATQLEQKIAARVGAKHGVVATSCTAAMFLALKACGIGHGDEVIVPDITFIATANAVDMTGATPVLVDVDPRTLTISIPAFEKAITARTKAVMPVHVTGRPAAMELLLPIAKAHNIQVIEDAAEALTGTYQGKYLGTIGKAGCFSFSANKTLSTGQGGIIVTDDEELAVKIRELKDQGRPVRGTGGDDLHNVIGYNFKFTNLQAAFGLGQFSRLDQHTARMKRNYEVYAAELQGITGFELYPCDLAGGSIPQWTDAKIERRDELASFLRGFNIDCRNYWFPLHRQKAYPLSDDAFPNSTYLCQRSLWLPSGFNLTDEDVRTVCSRIKEFYSST